MVGNSLGLNYEIPQVQGGGLLQPSQAEIAAQQPFQQANNVPMLPDINQDMAYKEGINDHLFNSYATLKRFAEDMNAKGIDVTKPDYSMPGGGDLYKTYKKLEADIYMTVDDLKRESDYEKQLAPQLAAGKVGYVEGFNPQTQFASQMNPQDVYFNKQLLPEVEFVNKQLIDNYYTQGDVNRANALGQAKIQELSARMNQATPAEKAQLQFNIDAIGQAMRQTGLSQLTPRPASAGDNKKVAAVDLYKRVTNTIKNAWEPSAFTASVDKDFNPVLVNQELSGTSLGSKPFVVRKQKKEYPLTVESIIAKDGKTYVRYVQPEEAKKDNYTIPDEDITGTKGDLFIKRIIENNKGLGLTTADLVTALKEVDLYGSTGSKDEKVVNTELVRDTKGLKKIVQAERQNLKDRLDNMQPNSSLTPTLPSGDTLEIKRDTGLLTFGKKFVVLLNGDQVESGLSTEGVEKYLRDVGYFDKFLEGQSITEAPQNTTKASAYKTKSGIVVDYNKVQEVASKQGLTAEQYIAKHGLIAQ